MKEIEALTYLLSKEGERVSEKLNFEASSSNQVGIDNCKGELEKIAEHVENISREQRGREYPSPM